MIRIFESPLIATLLLANVMAVGVVGATWLVPLPGASGGADEKAGPDRAETFAAQQQANLDLALERPIFHANRRKPQPPKAAPAPVVVAEKIEAPYLLVGVLGTNADSRTAYLQHKETEETIVVSVGQLAGTWRVDAIGNNFVTLVMGDDRQVIQLAGGG